MDFNKRRIAATVTVARLQTFGFFRFNRYKNDIQRVTVWYIHSHIGVCCLLSLQQQQSQQRKQQQQQQQYRFGCEPHRTTTTQSEWKNYIFRVAVEFSIWLKWCAPMDRFEARSMKDPFSNVVTKIIFLLKSKIKCLLFWWKVDAFEQQVSQFSDHGNTFSRWNIQILG